MKSIFISNYTWHATEDRVAVKYTYFNRTLNETVFYPREDWVRVVNSSGSFDFFYVIQNGKIIGMQDFNGKKFVILNDHKGSAYAVIDENKNVLELTFYEPYGGIISGGQYTRFDYEGEEQDPTTGDSDFDARKVDTLLGAGMFIEPDPIIQNIYDPQTLNHYMFEKNNPYKYEDETGYATYISGAKNQPKAERLDLVERVFALYLYKSERRELARQDLYQELLVDYNRENPESFAVPSFEQLEEQKLNQNLGVILDKEGDIYGYTDQGNGPYRMEYYLEQGYTKSLVQSVAERKRQEAISHLSYSDWLETDEGKKTYSDLKQKIVDQINKAREEKKENDNN